MAASQSPDRLAEVVARALAQHRLGLSEFRPGGALASQNTTPILERAVERLWPQLVEEGQAVATALRTEGLVPAATGDAQKPSEAAE